MSSLGPKGPHRSAGVSVAVTAAAVLLAGASQGWAQAVPTIRWAGRDTVAGRLVGPPDMRDVGVSPDFAAAVAAFDCGTPYANLPALLGVGADVLARADVIAFELNGGSPGEHGGWESTEWLIQDRGRSLRVVWDAVADTSDPPEVVIGNGSLTADSYRAYFGITTPRADQVISYQLLDLPAEFDVDSRGLRIKVRGFDSGEGTPDPDAIGVITRACGCRVRSEATCR
jgi:hypothetical protein